MYCHSLKSYEEAIAVEPKNAVAWKRKGIVLRDIGKYIECQETLKRAYNLNPNDVEICNILAEYYLRFGDIKQAYKYTEKALSIDKENAVSLGLKGKIKIEEQDYRTSSKCFKEAISLDLRNPVYLLWNSYAKYLMAELYLASDEKKYQDMILAIIRELEKIDVFSSQENDTNLKIIPCGFKNLIVYLLKLIKKTVIYFNVCEKLNFNLSEKFTLRLLEIIDPLLTKLENPNLMAYNYYFLGCFYYKINDYFTAIDNLKECKNLISDSKIEKSASEIIDNIWNNKVRPSIWKWWLYSPSKLWFRRISFAILVFFLFGILLPSKTSEFLAGSFFTSIDWNENTIPLTFLTLIILFILASPNIQNFKSSQIEIEVRPPPEFELTPSLIEKKLKDLKYISKP